MTTGKENVGIRCQGCTACYKGSTASPAIAYAACDGSGWKTPPRLPVTIVVTVPLSEQKPIPDPGMIDAVEALLYQRLVDDGYQVQVSREFQKENGGTFTMRVVGYDYA